MRAAMGIRRWNLRLPTPLQGGANARRRATIVVFGLLRERAFVPVGTVGRSACLRRSIDQVGHTTVTDVASSAISGRFGVSGEASSSKSWSCDGWTSRLSTADVLLMFRTELAGVASWTVALAWRTEADFLRGRLQEWRLAFDWAVTGRVGHAYGRLGFDANRWTTGLCLLDADSVVGVMARWTYAEAVLAR